jgi:hypothetical protein
MISLSTSFKCIIILASLLLFIGCKAKNKIKESNTDYTTSEISITAYDLSEDRSPFSSGGDEIMVFIFGDSNQEEPVLLYNTYHLVNQKPDTVAYSISSINKYYEHYTVVLIEIDENMVIEQELSDSIRKNIPLLEKSFNNKDLSVIKAIIKDNDVLGIKHIDQTKLFHQKGKITFKGTHLMDSYHYTINWY